MDHLFLDSVIRALTHLNLQNPEAARDVLLAALNDFTVACKKEITDGNRPAAA